MIASRRRVPAPRGSDRPPAVPRPTRGLRVWARRSEPAAVMICSACELSGGPFAAAEADHLASVHNQLHHRGTAHATVRKAT